MINDTVKYSCESGTVEAPVRSKLPYHFNVLPFLHRDANHWLTFRIFYLFQFKSLHSSTTTDNVISFVSIYMSNHHPIWHLDGHALLFTWYYKHRSPTWRVYLNLTPWPKSCIPRRRRRLCPWTPPKSHYSESFESSPSYTSTFRLLCYLEYKIWLVNSGACVQIENTSYLIPTL